MTQNNALINLSHCLDIFRVNYAAALDDAYESLEPDVDETGLMLMASSAESLIQDFEEFLEDNNISL